MKRSRTSQSTVLVAREATVPRTYRPSKKNKKSSWKDMCNAGLGFPKMLRMKHKYVETIVLTSSLGVMANHLWSCNGLYDPNITGVGHQPYYFDQVSALYRHFCVIGSKITVRAQNTSGSDVAYQMILWINDDTSTTPTAVNYVQETQTGKAALVNAYNNSIVPKLTQSWSATKYFGKNPLSNPELQGTTAANPTEQSYFQVSMQAAGNGTVSLNVTVEIEYDVIWKEVNDVATS